MSNVGGTLNVSNSVIAKNESGKTGFDGEGYGAGIYHNSNGKALTVTNCTIVGNITALVGGGIYIASGRLEIYSTIIVENGISEVRTAGSQQVSAYNNLVGNFVGASGAELNLTDTRLGNKVLTPIQTDTLFVYAVNDNYRLAIGSIAINAGNAAYAVGTTDRDGKPRIGAIDIGAYEFGYTELASTVVTTLNDIVDDIVDDKDGLISLREAISYAGTSGLGTTVTFADSLYRLNGTTLTVVSNNGTPRTIKLSGTDLYIGKDIIIDAGGMNITVDADQKSRVINIAEGVTVELIGLTITGGNVTGNNASGGGIYNAGILTVIDCAVIGNSVSVDSSSGTANIYGGGIYLPFPISCSDQEQSFQYRIYFSLRELPK